MERKKYIPPVIGKAGRKTLKNFLATAMMPVGHTLYVYGGGWDINDRGAAEQAVTIGLPKSWSDFFEKNNKYYTYKSEDRQNSYYPYDGINRYYYAGADCSGYVGWVIYNTMHKESGGNGYVMKSVGFAKNLAEIYNFGTWTRDTDKFCVGDIVSIKNHVWIYLGGCKDGSAVILHSTPSLSRAGMPGGGVQLTALGSKSSLAYGLVKKYMTDFYAKWSERYEPTVKNYADYIRFDCENVGRFSWYTDILIDDEGYKKMCAAEILSDLYSYITEY